MRQPSCYVPCLSGGNSPALEFPIVISIYRSCQGAEPKCYNLYMFLYSYSYKRLSWWWWCVCHPSFLTIRSASNGGEVSCGIFATIAHFSAPMCRKPLLSKSNHIPSSPHQNSLRNIFCVKSKYIFSGIYVYQNKSVFFQGCEQVLFYFGSVAMHGHIAGKRKRPAAFVSHPHTPGNREYNTTHPAWHIA